MHLPADVKPNYLFPETVNVSCVNEMSEIVEMKTNIFERVRSVVRVQSKIYRAHERIK